MHHPHRGMLPAPYLLVADWTRFLSWADAAIRRLEQPRPLPELEHLDRHLTTPPETPHVPETWGL